VSGHSDGHYDQNHGMEVEPFYGHLDDSFENLEAMIKQIKLPGSLSGEGFHITLDVPSVEKQEIVKAGPPLEERLSTLEAVNERNNAILEALLRALARKRFFSIEEMHKIINRGS